MENVQRAILTLSQERWWNDARTEPKLCTYVLIKDLSSPDILVKANLKRGICSLLAKLVSGILPLEVETGRYTSTPRDQRLCKICNLNLIEDEFHFLFDCIAYQLERSNYYVDNIVDIETFMLSTDQAKLAWMLQEDNIRTTGAFVNTLFRKRRDILYKKN